MLDFTNAPQADAETALRPLNEFEIDAVSGGITFDEAFETFIAGGALLGQGAAMLIASAYTGIALTPGLILESLGGLPGVPDLPGLPSVA